jgi:hypothetical protein
MLCRFCFLQNERAYLNQIKEEEWGGATNNFQISYTGYGLLPALQQRPVLVSGSHERGRSYLALEKRINITISEHDEISQPKCIISILNCEYQLDVYNATE